MMLQFPVLMERLGLLEELGLVILGLLEVHAVTKGELKSVYITHGGQSVLIIGMLTTLWWSAGNWGTLCLQVKCGTLCYITFKPIASHSFACTESKWSECPISRVTPTQLHRR